MNERIRQLWRQVKLQECDCGCNPDEFLRLKFAELIVQECSRVIVNGGYWSGGPIGPKRQCTPPEIAQMIKEHFGVEE